MRAHPELALGLLRVMTGGLFAWHGYAKIFAVGLRAVTAEFQRAGVPLPLLTAPLSATLELAGGVLLLLGLGSRGLALLLALSTAAALLLGSRHAPPLPAPLPGAAQWETPALMLVACLALALGGGGRPGFGGYVSKDPDLPPTSPPARTPASSKNRTRKRSG